MPNIVDAKNLYFHRFLLETIFSVCSSSQNTCSCNGKSEKFSKQKNNGKLYRRVAHALVKFRVYKKR